MFILRCGRQRELHPMSHQSNLNPSEEGKKTGTYGILAGLVVCVVLYWRCCPLCVLVSSTTVKIEWLSMEWKLSQYVQLNLSPLYPLARSFVIGPEAHSLTRTGKGRAQRASGGIGPMRWSLKRLVHR
jgi:hypothetical protein